MSNAVRTSITYAIGSTLGRVVSFLMLPVYTHYVDPAEYAKLSLVLMTVDVLTIATSAGTTAGFLRFYYKASNDQGRHQVTFTALALNVALNLIGSIILLTAARPLASLVLSSPEDANLFRILGFCFTLEACIIVPLIMIQARQQAALFVGTTLSRTVFSALLNLVFLIGFGWGIHGILLSTLISSAIMGIGLVFFTVRFTGLSWSPEAARDLRRFGVPYQIAAAGSFILTFGDRYVMKASRSLDEVGLYAFGYQFGFLLWSLTAMPFFQMWMPLRYKMLNLPREERDREYNQAFKFLNVVMITGAVGISLGVTPMLNLLTTPAFHAAAAFVPVVLAAYVVQSWSETVSFGIDASEQTRYATMAFWGATIATGSLYFALIPPYGAWGAATATLLGYLVRFGLAYRFAHRLTPISYDWRPVIQLIVMGVITVIIGRLVAPAGLVPQFGVASALGLAFMLAVWFFVLKSEEQVLIRLYVTKFVNRIPIRMAHG